MVCYAFPMEFSQRENSEGFAKQILYQTLQSTSPPTPI